MVIDEKTNTQRCRYSGWKEERKTRDKGGGRVNGGGQIMQKHLAGGDRGVNDGRHE